MEQNLKLSSPWYTFYSDMEALFKNDKDIMMDFNDEDMVITMRVTGQAKAEALAQILPDEVEFGNIVVKIIIKPSNLEEKVSYVKLFQQAFMGNDVLKNAVELNTPMGDFYYAIFKKEVVQYYNDQMNDINGNRTTLYENIAKEVFRPEIKMFYCTSAE